MQSLLADGVAEKQLSRSIWRLNQAEESLSLTRKENSVAGQLQFRMCLNSKKRLKKKIPSLFIIPMVTLRKNSVRLPNGLFLNTIWQCREDGTARGFILRLSATKLTTCRDRIGLTRNSCKSSAKTDRRF